jgi:hypothetical protein
MNSSNKIFAEISVGELIDKITILEIKKANIKEAEKLKIVDAELVSLSATLNKNVKISNEIQNLRSDLKKINQKLWIIEDDIRNCERQKDFGDKFKELARSVYFSNDERAKLKNQINKLSGSSIGEVKSYEKY